MAITGNLTVVGQQQAGYASLTPLPDDDPATSTINFPLGDNRANNLTSPLSNAGGVSLTYKASPGKQTHFILDVTGYFLNDDTGADVQRPDAGPRPRHAVRTSASTARSRPTRTGSSRSPAVGAIPANAKSRSPAT